MMLIVLAVLATGDGPAAAPPTTDNAISGADGARPHVIRGTIVGCSGEHPIVILLIGSDYFEKGKPLQTVVREASAVKDGKVTFELRVAPGTYAVSAFEDENRNGRLDMGWLGPSEPAQFYRRFTAWRAPRFDDVSFAVDRGIINAVIDID